MEGTRSNGVSNDESRSLPSVRIQTESSEEQDCFETSQGVYDCLDYVYGLSRDFLRDRSLFAFVVR